MVPFDPEGAAWSEKENASAMFEWSWATSYPDFKVAIIQRQITRNWYNIELYLRWPTDRKSLWSIELRRFQWPWTTHSLDLKVTPLFDAEYLRNGTRCRHSFNGFTHALLKGVISNDLEWSWVTWQTIQWHEASRGLSATAELLV